MTEIRDSPWAEGSPEAVVASTIENFECTCEFVDIGVGWQKVSENPVCAHCTLQGHVLTVVDALRKANMLSSAE